jgi:uncharacterized protein (TIGR00369 family)
MPNELAAHHATLKRLELARKAYLTTLSPQNFSHALISTVSLLSAKQHSPTSGHAVFTASFPKGQYANASGVVHGGAIALLLDCCANSTGFVIAEKGGEMRWGVTKSLEIGFLGAVKEGERVRVECEVVRKDEKGLWVRGVMKRVSGAADYAGGEGEVVAVCSMEGAAASGRRAKL